MINYSISTSRRWYCFFSTAWSRELEMQTPHVPQLYPRVIAINIPTLAGLIGPLIPTFWYDYSAVPHTPFAMGAPIRFRLLELLPGRADTPLRCTLRVASLNKRPKFEALSYVWGDPTGRRTITVNGDDFEVTTNLEEGLRSPLPVQASDTLGRRYLHQPTGCGR